jgi:anti-anti-sigma regulatory factor
VQSDITVSQIQGRVPVTILRLHGDLDAANYRDLIARAQEVYDGGARDILLDLSEVPYMSSSGLVALQSIASLLRGDALPDLESGWGTFHALDHQRDLGLQPHFRLLSPQPRVAHVLEVVGFERFLEVHTDLGAAIAAF